MGNGSADRPPPSPEERRLALDEKRLQLESSFARKWFPTLATVVIGLSAAIFGYVQNQTSANATERARNDAAEATKRAHDEARVKDEREWGFKVVEMYFQRRELFDVTKSPEQATANLKVLVAMAPTAVQGLISAEQDRLPSPGGDAAQQSARLNGLAALADIQSAIAQRKARPDATASAAIAPASLTVYLQYPEGARDTALSAQARLRELGFNSPGMEEVRNVPSKLQVRYYKKEQRQVAADLAVKVGQTLGLPASAESAVMLKTDKALPDGILELWLPRPGS